VSKKRNKRIKRNPWVIIPSHKPEDQLYNRRILTYLGLAYSAIWFQEVLIVLIVCAAIGAPIDGAIVAALLGVPTSLAGLGFWRYLEACKRDDLGKIKPDEKKAP